MLRALHNYGVNTNFVKIIQKIYSRLKAQIVTDIIGEEFHLSTYKITNFVHFVRKNVKIFNFLSD